MSRHVLWIWILILASQSACYAPGGHRSESHLQIYRGRPVPAASAVSRSSVFILNQTGERSFCTGTLVGKRLVATAAHCFVAPYADSSTQTRIRLARVGFGSDVATLTPAEVRSIENVWVSKSAAMHLVSSVPTAPLSAADREKHEADFVNLASTFEAALGTDRIDALTVPQHGGDPNSPDTRAYGRRLRANAILFELFRLYLERRPVGVDGVHAFGALWAKEFDAVSEALDDVALIELSEDAPASAQIVSIAAPEVDPQDSAVTSFGAGRRGQAESGRQDFIAGEILAQDSAKHAVLIGIIEGELCHGDSGGAVFAGQPAALHQSVSGPSRMIGTLSYIRQAIATEEYRSCSPFATFTDWRQKALMRCVVDALNRSTAAGDCAPNAHEELIQVVEAGAVVPHVDEQIQAI